MLRVDTDELIKLTVKLEKVHRAAFPNAVRSTLNNAAFETKKEIPIQGQKKFITRSKGFLRAFSTVDKATGFNVNRMVATTGINSKKGSKVASNLEKQEFGGSLYTSKIVPHDDSRVSKSHSKRLRRKNWPSKINAHNSTQAFKSHTGTRGSKFVAAVMSAAKRGKKYMILESQGRGMLYEIKGLKSNRKTGRLNFKVDKLFSIKRSSRATTQSKGFIRASKNKVIKKITKNYKNNAEYQLKKYWK